MTAVQPHRVSDAAEVVDDAKVTVYWFDEHRRLRRDDARSRSELPGGAQQLFGGGSGTSVRPIHDDAGRVVGIATRMS